VAGARLQRVGLCVLLLQPTGTSSLHARGHRQVAHAHAPLHARTRTRTRTRTRDRYGRRAYPDHEGKSKLLERDVEVAQHVVGAHAISAHNTLSRS
jgi:hypothetical protein